MKHPSVLFLVHVEEMFRNYFPDSMYVNRLLQAFNVYDRVVCLLSHVEAFDPIYELSYNWRSPEEIVWGWGYERDMDYGPEDDAKKWVIGSTGHEYTWVPPEVRDPSVWTGYSVSVGGGGRWECMADWLCVLDHVKIPFRVVNGYCYGN